MKRLLSLAALAATALVQAGCGGTACTSTAATPQNTGAPSCTVAAGQTVTFTVALCGKCTDTSPSCQAEFVNNEVEVSPTVQQCQEQAGCNIAAGCDISSPRATCTATIPAGTSGSVPLRLVADNTYTGTVTIGSGTSCNL